MHLALLSASLISLGPLVGVFTITVKQETLSKILLFLVSLSAGTLMGGAFFHLLPEAAEQIPSQTLFPAVLFSFIFFFLLEKIIHWRHCHNGVCDTHSFGPINLVGDAVHNFIDGLIIAGAFIADPKLGFISALAIAMHEIPQEIGDFGVLLYSGYTRAKALLLNLAVSATSIAGVLLGFLLKDTSESLLSLLIPLAAGGFIYISASDLMPEIRKETSLKKSLISFGIFLLGIAIMFVSTLLE